MDGKPERRMNVSDGTKIDYPGSPCWHCGSTVHDTAGHAHTAPIMDGQPTTMPTDGECVKCHEAMSIRDGEEPTMYCDHCAHDQIATLTTRIAELEKGLRTCQEFILAHEKWEGEILLDNSLWQHGNDPFPHPGEAEVLQARRNYAKAEASRLLEGRQ